MTVNNEQLRNEVAEQKDKSKQLSDLLIKLIDDNQNQMEQINSQTIEIVQLKDELQQLKVS